jgi:hypothetical protein
MSRKRLFHFAWIVAVQVSLQAAAAETIHALKYPEYVIWLLWAVIAFGCFKVCVIAGRPKQQT